MLIKIHSAYIYCDKWKFYEQILKLEEHITNPFIQTPVKQIANSDVLHTLASNRIT